MKVSYSTAEIHMWAHLIQHWRQVPVKLLHIGAGAYLVNGHIICRDDNIPQGQIGHWYIYPFSQRSALYKTKRKAAAMATLAQKGEWTKELYYKWSGKKPLKSKKGSV